MDVGVLLVGWDRQEPRAEGHSFVRIRVDELPDLKLDGWPVMVLGDRALEQVDPHAVMQLTHKRQVRVILVPNACSGRRFVRWLRARFGETVLPGDLDAALEGQPREESRPQPASAGWLPRRPHPETDAARAVGVIPDLVRPFSVQEWSATLSWNRQRLWRVCQSAFGISPKALLDRYIDAVVAAGRAEGMSLTALAQTLGFSDAAALLHSLDREGRHS